MPRRPCTTFAPARARTRVLAAAGWLLAGAVLAPPAHAAWTPGGVPLTMAALGQNAAQSVADGAGGAYVMWIDFRSGTADLYAQHVLGDGTIAPGWPADGLVVCDVAGAPSSPVLCGDGQGGAYAAWSDARLGSPDVYALRLSSGGIAPGWVEDGLVVSDAVNSQSAPAIAPDGTGGAILAWADSRGSTTDIYAMRVLGSGAVDPAWTADGNVVCNAVRSQTQAAVCSDGAGGAIVAWADGRNGSTLTPDQDVYALRITSAGVAAPNWTANGDPVCQHAAADQQNVVLLSDGAQGAFFVWQDGRNGPRVNQVKDLFASRHDGNGDLVSGWTANGTAVVQAAGDQTAPVLATDGGGGLYVAWQDGRDTSTFPTNTDIYGLRLTGAGARAAGWTADGVNLTALSPTREDDPSIAPDAAHGIFLGWEDTRNGGRVYVQRIAGDGTRASAWPAGGIELSATDGAQLDAALVSDGAGGVVVAWDDPRLDTTDRNVFAQRLSATGQIGPTVDVPAPGSGARLALSMPGAHPAVGRVRFLLETEPATPFSASIYGPAGRRVWSLGEAVADGSGRYTLSWTGKDDLGRRAPPGVYWLRVSAGPQSAATRFVFLP